MCRGQERHRRRILAIKPALRAQPHESAAEHVIRHDVGVIGADALGQKHIVEAELLAPFDFRLGDVGERAVGEQR